MQIGNRSRRRYWLADHTNSRSEDILASASRIVKDTHYEIAIRRPVNYVAIEGDLARDWYGNSVPRANWRLASLSPQIDALRSGWCFPTDQDLPVTGLNL